MYHKPPPEKTLQELIVSKFNGDTRGITLFCKRQVFLIITDLLSIDSSFFNMNISYLIYYFLQLLNATPDYPYVYIS